MSGGASKLAIRRQQLMPEVRRWIRLHKQHEGFEPSSGDQRQAVDNPAWLASQVEKYEAMSPVVTINHPDACECRKCIAERPLSGGTWGEFAAREFERMENRRIAAELESQRQRLLAAKMVRDTRRKVAIKAANCIPFKVLKRHQSGAVSRDVLKAAFGVTDEAIVEILWAYGLSSTRPDTAKP